MAEEKQDQLSPKQLAQLRRTIYTASGQIQQMENNVQRILDRYPIDGRVQQIQDEVKELVDDTTTTAGQIQQIQDEINELVVDTNTTSGQVRQLQDDVQKFRDDINTTSDRVQQELEQLRTARIPMNSTHTNEHKEVNEEEKEEKKENQDQISQAQRQLNQIRKRYKYIGEVKQLQRDLEEHDNTDLEEDESIVIVPLLILFIAIVIYGVNIVLGAKYVHHTLKKNMSKLPRIRVDLLISGTVLFAFNIIVFILLWTKWGADRFMFYYIFVSHFLPVISIIRWIVGIILTLNFIYYIVFWSFKTIDKWIMLTWLFLNGIVFLILCVLFVFQVGFELFSYFGP